MEAHDHLSKRIKLSLEPEIEQTAVDINNTGQEIYKTEQSLAEKLMQNVDRIWLERGDWRDVSETDLQHAILSKDTTDSLVSSSVTDTATPQPAVSTPHGMDIIKLRECVVNKLFHAKSEIDVALDVINILAAQNRLNTTTKDLVLPTGTLTATYVSKPKATPKAQLEATQLTLGLKRKQQKTAAAYLKASAASLRTLVEKENVFWEEALDLRRNNWSMQAKSASGHSGHATGAGYLVQYGFSEVGSDFTEASLGVLNRTKEEVASVALSLPHGQNKQVVVTIYQSSMEPLGMPIFSGGLFGKRHSEQRSLDTVEDTRTNTVRSGSRTHQRLVEARATVFDSELFANISSEAQTLNNNSRIADDEIIVALGGRVDLSIQKVSSLTCTSPVPRTDTPSTQHMAGQSIELALRLMLIQRYRFNLWKNRARILSCNRKAHYFLSSLGENPSFGPAVTAHPTSHATTTGSSTSTSTITSTTTSSTSSTGAAGITTPLHRSGRFQSAGASASFSSAISEMLVLSPVLSMARFWILFDRVRSTVDKIIDPFCGEGGVGLSVHFKSHSTLQLRGDTMSYDTYPSFGERWASLTIGFLKGPFLYFLLSPQGTITTTMPQTEIVLTQVSEFQALLLRQVTLVSLSVVCEESKTVIHQSAPYLTCDSSGKAMFEWKVNEVEETLYGFVWWGLSSKPSHSHVWRAVQVKLVQSWTQHQEDTPKRPVYWLQLRMEALSATALHPAAPKVICTVTLGRVLSQPSDQGEALTFRERVRTMISSVIEMGATTG
ncbi:subunit 17 of mediator complex-domain-containing protein [Spinellus fusiger]|nr:subunit 17 of mediator complex-domain-containing protein [Spinellus fusiger]